MKQWLVRNPRGVQVGFVMARDRGQAMFEANRTYGKGSYILTEC